MTIAVYCETPPDDGAELIFRARAMAPQARIVAIHEGPDAELCFRRGADETLLLEAAEDDCVQGGRIADEISRLSPDAALFPATVRGRFLSAWAAAKLKTGLTADCTDLSLTADGLFRQTRPAFGGGVTADILCPEKRPQMASVRPGTFPPAREAPSAPHVTAGIASCAMPPPLMRLIGRIPAETGCPIRQAKVIVAGGKGIGGREGFALLYQLAELLGGAVGASRGAVDAGWIPYAHQVGQTGAAVSPALYLAFGISGMIQHVVGIRNAGVVVAVNTDRNAPVFQSADYGIVAPWRETCEYMIAVLKERRGQNEL